MVIIEDQIWNKIDEYITHIIGEGYCTPIRAKEKLQTLLLHLHKLDKGICTDTPSTHRSFGKKEGYLYGFFKDKKSKAQWNYLYERFDEDGKINVIVHDLCCGGLKDSMKFISLHNMLT